MKLDGLRMMIRVGEGLVFAFDIGLLPKLGIQYRGDDTLDCYIYHENAESSFDLMAVKQGGARRKDQSVEGGSSRLQGLI